MNWNTIISDKRTGVPSNHGIRTGYQVDFDRIIFSSAFRRLQNKTQVFPLPGSAFLHNRLTHSLEVSSVGRSLGKLAGKALIKNKLIDEANLEFYEFELQNVVAAACLAHDIGNPPFGHTGEKAISNYFISNKLQLIAGKALHEYFSEPQWNDLVTFEGNANSLRVLIHQFNGKSTGGYRLTYTTLAALIKYPCESVASSKGKINTKKFGFFQSELAQATEILETLQVIRESSQPAVFCRHPFVYLTEAADDICYRIIDFEDAHRLHIMEHNHVTDTFISLLNEIKPSESAKTKTTLQSISDKNEQVSYLRAKCINALVEKAADEFTQNSDHILQGKYNCGLIDTLEKRYPTLQSIAHESNEKIYNHESVVQLELLGYKVMSDLLSLFIPAVLAQSPAHKEQKILKLLPGQFTSESANPYDRVFSVLDYLSGMTDPYIIELYRKLFGIEIPRHTGS